MNKLIGEAGPAGRRIGLSANIVDRLQETAAEQQVSPQQLVSAAWMKVRSTFTGEPSLPDGSWLSLLDHLAAQEPHFEDDLLAPEDQARLDDYVAGVLTALVNDPHSAHERHSLLSEDDVRQQLAAMHGPVRQLTDRRVYELITEVAHRRPQAIAGTHGTTHWTYQQLNRRANAIARRLAAAGAQPQDVICVHSERTLPWVAAILGILKAGMVYLPIDPSYPQHRVDVILGRSGTRFVLADSADNINAELAAWVLLESSQDDSAAHDEDVEACVSGDALAYIYFTSGSTGEPKGAMCEHDGMLNHLLGKVADLEMVSSDTVCQNAPQCFDISLWQVLAPLLIGGRVVIMPTQAILDVEVFLATLLRERVSVLQVVPSYLDVMLAHLRDRPHERPELRIVSVTGEAVSRSLTARWFDQFPHVPLVNAYGATELSDDVTHEVLRSVPLTEHVPIGSPLPNVVAYVLDRHGGLVPLGALGQLAFAGVSVGRGYINDPVRTAEAFQDDPFNPGQRLYLTGDYGRWLPSGKLEFLGRRDGQVKISGMRVELGEVENHILAVAQVRSASVVVVPAGPSQRLAAFYTSVTEIDDLKQHLTSSLPVHMVPSTVHRLESMPLTANGKVDKATLVKMASAHIPAQRVPVTGAVAPLERRIATAWAEVLNRPAEDIRSTDNFFEIGGSSLSAIQLVTKLDGLVSLADLTSKPVLADLVKAAGSS